MEYPTITLLKRRRTKIIATLGPACRDPVSIEQLVRAGVNVFRMNLAHGDYDEHKAAYEAVRAVAGRAMKPIAILADLSGPRMRVGKFAQGRIELTTGSRVVVTTRDVVGGPGLIPSQYAGLAHDVRPGDRIFLDDGMLELRVEGVSDTEITCQVVYGGVLKAQKGMNLPGVNISAPALTDKDRKDAQFALELGVDFLALSFVRRADDVMQLKCFVTTTGHTAPVIAKIEKPEALDAIESIVEAADAIMVARGDLGVELPPEVIPVAQHRLVAKARAKNKPVIIATQMLESMIARPRPTRAEVSDISHAVFSGADAVMLSAETAVGAYPLQAVEMMDKVARHVEGWQWDEGAFQNLSVTDDLEPPMPLNVAMARTTAQLSRDIKARTIVVLTHTGTTAAMVAGARPGAPIAAATTDASAYRRMNLLWGVLPIQVEAGLFKHANTLARRVALDLGLASVGQQILLVAGFRSDALESAPMVTVLTV